MFTFFFFVISNNNIFFFFFSSRRRHTSLQGDWSSDVCSSDLFRSASAQRCLDGSARQMRVPNRCEPPGQHPPRVLVQHGGQIPPAAADGQVSHIADPDLVRCRRSGPPHAIRMLIEPSVRPGLPPIDPHHARSPAPDTHEPLDSPSTDPMTARRQRPMHTRAPIRTAAAVKDPLHRLEKNPVLFPVCALGPLPPSVVAGPRHTIQP